MTVTPFSGRGAEDSPANLWIGLLDLEILAGCTVFEDSDAKGAAIYFVAMAPSEGGIPRNSEGEFKAS
jgi:hypothetical protein